MMLNNPYVALVNRQLAAADFQLSLLARAEVQRVYVYRQSCSQAALLHGYLALCAYCNELLGYYRLPLLSLDHEGGLPCLSFEHLSQQFCGIAEFDEWRRLVVEDKTQCLLPLCRLPTLLLDPEQGQPTIGTSERPQDRDNATLIASSSGEANSMDLFSLDGVRSTLNILRTVIERQRNYHFEC